MNINQDANAQATVSNNSKPNILFLFADDWGWPSADLYGDTVIQLQTFDWVAAHGMLFNNAFCSSPSCSPSRASVLTGQYPHRLEQGSQLWGVLPSKFPNYADLLDKAGYLVGLQGKGYGPHGNESAVGYEHNPAGKQYKDFSSFLDSLKKDQSFCFWYGDHKPHRPYQKGIGKSLNVNPDEVQVPGYLPNVREVQNDFLDYYYEVQQFDSSCWKIISLLKEKGLLQNTLIVISGDNGYPFPRAKANLYDGGTHIPLAIMWEGRVKPKTVSDAFVNLADLAPTFLKATGLSIPKQMTAKNLLPVLKELDNGSRFDRVYLEMERHGYAHKGNVGYPMRAIRTKRFLYIRNFEPERWPAGDPDSLSYLGPFGSCDRSPSKAFIITHPQLKPSQSITDKTYYQLAFGKRPNEELYDLEKDLDEVNNVANEAAYKSVLIKYRKELKKWMKETDDPRAKDPHTNIFNTYPYYGPEFIDAMKSK